MALHRDIYWIGRQWAITGFGVQAIDQRLKGAFDIEASRMWEDGLPEQMRALAWVNGEDFDKALAMARKRFPESERKSPTLVESVLQLIEQAPSAASPQPVTPAPVLASGELGEAAVRALPPLKLRIQGALTRFVPQWRTRR
jgi:hypothetical protein